MLPGVSLRYYPCVRFLQGLRVHTTLCLTRAVYLYTTQTTYNLCAYTEYEVHNVQRNYMYAGLFLPTVIDLISPTVMVFQCQFSFSSPFPYIQLSLLLRCKVHMLELRSLSIKHMIHENEKDLYI